MDNAPFADSSINQDLIDCLVQAGLEEELASQIAPTETGDHPAILVLPFSNLSGDPEQEYFSDGITESLIVNLSSFSGLNVKSRHTSFAYKNSEKSIQEIAEILDIQYMIEGSIRKFGDNIRITVQLNETDSGNQLWGKRFESSLDELFSIEEELVQTIAGTISGRIGRELKSAAVLKSANSLKSYDYLMRGWHHMEKFTPQDTATAVELLNRCIEIDPGNADAHALVAVSHINGLYENWTADRLQTKSLAQKHFIKALDLDPDNALTHAFMVEYYLLSGNLKQALFHANRSIELNPTLPEGYAIKAYISGISRQPDEAVEFADIAMKIDPYHYYMGWSSGEAYMHAGEFARAIDAARSVPHIPASLQAEIAACLAGLDQLDEARLEMQQFHRRAREEMPDYPMSIEAWRSLWRDTTPCKYEEDFETFFDLLIQAGLCDDIADPLDDIPSIAVLPFENMSGDPEQEYFSDGITTDIISTLSKFNHMRIVARHSTLQYKNQQASIAEIAEQQGVRYILEGSVRKSGNRIRVNAELIDSHSEQICWSEHYDSDLDDLFAAQDEMTKNVALAMKVHLDDGDMALQRSTGTTNIKAWQLALAAVDLQETYIRENILEARAMAHEAIKLDPGYPYAWIVLGWTHWQEAYSGWCEAFEIPLAEAEKANQHASGIAPEYAEVWSQAGIIHVMKHEPEQALKACRKAVELEPGNAEIQALMAFSLIFDGNYEQARLHQHNMLKLCPVLPNWYYLIGGQIEQNAGDLDEAIQSYQQGIDVEPDSPLCRFYLIDAMLERGDETRAKILAEEIRALDQTVTGKGIVRSISQDKSIRDRFQASLDKFDLL
jgi:TolB-like protein/Tfp pilus assembly protein PilF